MSYIHKIINSDERIILISRPHWIYLFKGILLAALVTGTGMFLNYVALPYTGPGNLGVIFLLGFIFALSCILFATYAAIYMASEIGLTNQRIVYKRGLFRIEVEEIDLDEIKGEIVHHGFLGWLLGYGRIHLDCRYAEDIELPAIAKPYQLLRSMHKARFNHPRTNYTQEKLNHHMERLNTQQAMAEKRKILKDFRSIR